MVLNCDDTGRSCITIIIVIKKIQLIDAAVVKILNWNIVSKINCLDEHDL